MIHIFLGTKAQLIKMAPIMKELQNRNIPYNFVFSGQHQATIADIQKEFGLKNPDYILYKGPDITGVVQMFFWTLRVLTHVLLNKKDVWKGDQKGLVLSHGDTFSTLLGALSARLSGLQSAHVESGLRSFNLLHPFPEELTRRLVFRLSQVFYAPGDWALNNLSDQSGIKVNTKQNTLRDALSLAEQHINEQIVDIPDTGYGIASIHRFENLLSRKRLTSIIEIIEDAAQHQRILFILHKPTIKKLTHHKLLERLENNPNIELRPRYSYFQFIKLVKKSLFVMTDGGSNQEECYYLGKPCLILRKASERQEGIGENAIISNYSKEICWTFFENLAQHTQPLSDNSIFPSRIIVDHATSYTKLGIN
jgi:UDP-N-acetylglucosamine 2-epimerase (non-hydrolysing)